MKRNAASGLFTKPSKIVTAPLAQRRMLGVRAYRLAVDPAAIALLSGRATHAHRETRDLGAPKSLSARPFIHNPDIGNDQQCAQIIEVRRKERTQLLRR